MEILEESDRKTQDEALITATNQCREWNVSCFPM